MARPNSNILKFQTNQLQRILGEDFEWRFVDGPCPWEPRLGHTALNFSERTDIEKALAKGLPFVQWYSHPLPSEKDPLTQVLFLPECLQGSQVLVPTDEEGYFLVYNPELRGNSEGVQYRRSMDLNDRDPALAKWGEKLQGVLIDGWLKVSAAKPEYDFEDVIYLNVEHGLKFLDKTFVTEGPIDVLVCYSQSATLAAMYLDLLRREGREPPWRLSAFFCGAMIDDVRYQLEEPLLQPTIYVSGGKGDPWHEHALKTLPKMYTNILMLAHDDGHAFPSRQPHAGKLYKRIVWEMRTACGLSALPPDEG